jgi:hypothetical protein
MDDAGLLHLATRMPQLLHLDVTGCSRITSSGLSTARVATVVGCASHCMVIEGDPSESDGSDWNTDPDELEGYPSEYSDDL